MKFWRACGSRPGLLGRRPVAPGTYHRRPSRTRATSAQAADPSARIRRVRRLVCCHEDLNPVTDEKLSVYIWKCISSLEPKDRLQMLDYFGSSDIKQLWAVSQELFTGKTIENLPVEAMMKDFPTAEQQDVVAYEGKAALPVPVPLVSRFRKLFAWNPTTQSLLGRVDVKKGPLGSWLYPLYFTASVGDISVVPGISEPALGQLQYLTEEECEDAGVEGLRGSLDWPAAATPLFPFHPSLIDLLRPVGPGVYVGCGWDCRGGDEYQRFLPFLLVKAAP